MQTKLIDITRPKRAIIMFGPPTEHSGMRPAEYYQVTLDPNMASPEGEFLRFDQTIQGGEMHGWQRIECLTVCEILGDAEPYPENRVPKGYEFTDKAVLTLAIVDHG